MAHHHARRAPPRRPPAFAPLTLAPIAALLACLWLPAMALAQPAAAPAAERPVPTVMAPATAPDAARAPTAEEAFHARIRDTPLPGNGCFTATQADARWVSVPCGKPPAQPYPPSGFGTAGTAPVPNTVGNGADRSAHAVNPITSATGSFDAVTGLVREVQGTGDENYYSLQLNSNSFESPIGCAGAKVPKDCRGWQQVIYSPHSAQLFTQYWLLNYGNACPKNPDWAADTSGNCWRNADNSVPVPAQPIGSLARITITSKAALGGNDTATMFIGPAAYTEANPDHVLELSKGWTSAEFNVFGDCCNNVALFNAGTSLTVRTQVNAGTANAPTCTGAGFTGETNNLTIVDPCTAHNGPLPAITFTERAAPLREPGSLWQATFQPCTGTACPGWSQLDENPATARIATNDTWLYQLHGTGRIWRYTGIACFVGCAGWEMLDSNADTIQIAASGTALYQMHKTGKIWRFTGTACTGAGCPGWQMLDNNPDAATIVAAGGNLYQLHKTGKIWKYTGTPCNGDRCTGWQMLDANSQTVAIAAAGNTLYQLHATGKIWKYTGAACTGNTCPGWQMLDTNAQTIAIAAGGNALYQLHDTGKIWKYTGTACTGTSCPGWQMLDTNAQTQSITASGNALYQMHSTGKVWKYTGTACTGTNCPGWQMLDDNANTGRIAASDTRLYQLHGPRSAPQRKLVCADCLTDTRLADRLADPAATGAVLTGVAKTSP